MAHVYAETGRFGRGDHVVVDSGHEPPFSATVVNIAHRLEITDEVVYRLRPDDGGHLRFARESWLRRKR